MVHRHWPDFVPVTGCYRFVVLYSFLRTLGYNSFKLLYYYVAFNALTLLVLKGIQLA